MQYADVRSRGYMWQRHRAHEFVRELSIKSGFTAVFPTRVYRKHIRVLFLFLVMLTAITTVLVYTVNFVSTYIKYFAQL